MGKSQTSRLIMKFLIVSVFVLSLSSLSLQAYHPVPPRLIPPPPTPQYPPPPPCQPVPDRVCADVEEQVCEPILRPQEGSAYRKECWTEFAKKCKTAEDTKKQRNRVQDEQCY